MNEKQHDRIEPNNERYGESASKPGPEQQPTASEAMYAQAGYPFPLGPVIPRPDSRWKPLWLSLEVEGLNRPKAAAQVLLKVYRNDDGDDRAWKPKKEALTSRMDLAFRNHWQRIHPQDQPESLMTSEVSLQALDGWSASLRGTGYQMDFEDLINEKLRPDLRHSYHAGRNEARAQSLLFAPPFYPSVGSEPQEVVSEVPWALRYGETTKQHVRELLLEDAGEWNVLTLLFVKLIHAHMAWLVPQMREQRQIRYYRPLLRHLHLCAEQAGSQNAHPLADTAAGLLQTLHRMNLLVSSGKSNDPEYPKHPDELDPTAEPLPDSLHMDSAMWVNEAVSEVKAIFKWMDDEATNDGTKSAAWAALTPWVDDVANLAWEMASARTDPFSLGALEMVGDTKFNTVRLFTQHMGAWSEITKGIRVRVRQLQGMALSKADIDSLNYLPSRFKAAFWVDGAPTKAHPNEHIDKTIREVEAWAERPAQLRLYYDSMSKALTSYGLDKFQAAQRTTP